MPTVSFQNKGLLDVVSITTFGINAKEKDGAIGYFGTGLKYAIAVLLREGYVVTIATGDNVFFFDVTETVVRGKNFGVVHMNGTPLGFTTELGKNWEVWQAFRELYCNALDENGSVVGEKVVHLSEGTTVSVSGDKEDFYSCYLNRGEVVLETEPFITHTACDIHKGETSLVYYKGVRIYDALWPSMYTYNIKHGVEITEDRTAKYEHHLRYSIATAIISSTDEKFIREALLAPHGSLEHEIDLSDGRGAPSNVFLDVAEGLRLNVKVNPSITVILARNNRLPPPSAMVLDEVQTVMLERAVSFCKSLGYPVDKYPVVTSDELSGGLHGLAENRSIYLSPDAFGMGTKYLASTLIEEYLHLHTGFGDCTRNLQSHLFNEIVTLGERLMGEPV